ncbi:MAG TPA: IS200/IS605 family transposase [Pyrinomonadaceae bacterium]|nr:IS200/IS605 family transposase [Pyrinomonadaceae bacterium]
MLKRPSLKATNKKNMPQSVYKMLAHIVFSTKNRADLIAPEIETGLFGYIHGIAENKGAKLIIAGGTANHIHLLVSLPKKIDVPELIGDIKRDSSSWIKKQDARFYNFYWQKGYGAFSIGQSQIPTVVNYIKRQKEHHKSQDFKDEFRILLKKYEIEYDERYVWD